MNSWYPIKLETGDAVREAQARDFNIIFSVEKENEVKVQLYMKPENFITVRDSDSPPPLPTKFYSRMADLISKLPPVKWLS